MLRGGLPDEGWFFVVCVSIFYILCDGSRFPCVERLERDIVYVYLFVTARLPVEVLCRFQVLIRVFLLGQVRMTFFFGCR